MNAGTAEPLTLFKDLTPARAGRTRPLPAMLQQYVIEETSLGKGKLRVTVALASDSAVEQVFITRRGYDRRGLLWRAHNDIQGINYRRPRHRPGFGYGPHGCPEGVPYWRDRLDALAKRAAWRPNWEHQSLAGTDMTSPGAGYVVPIGTGLDLHGNTKTFYCAITYSGSGFAAWVDSTTGEPSSSAFHTKRTCELLAWIRSKRKAVA